MTKCMASSVGYAIHFGRMAVVQALLKRNIELLETDVYGRSAFHIACMTGKFNILRTLVPALPIRISEVRT